MDESPLAARAMGRRGLPPPIVARRARSVLAISVVLGLLATHPARSAPGAFPRLPAEDTFIEIAGLLIEVRQILRVTGKKPVDFLGSQYLEALEMRLDLDTRDAETLSMRPAGQGTVSGGGASLSRDDACAVGHQDAGPFTPYHALRWTAAGGPMDLGTLDAPNNASRSSFARAVSDDCNVVVGTSDIAGGAVQRAFRWTAAAGMVDLGAPAGAGRNSRGLGASADGNVIVGDAEFVPAGSSFAVNRAFRWTAAGGFQDLGALSALGRSLATGVSGDGGVVIGQAEGPFSGRAFRWTAAAGLQSLGTLPGHGVSMATRVSDNGNVVAGISDPSYVEYRGEVLGFATSGAGSRAFRWTAATGMQDLRAALVAAGVDMTGITLHSVTAMSADGQWLAGQATMPTTPAGQTEAYIAQLCDGAIGGACIDIAAPPPSFALGTASAALSAAAGGSVSTAITVTPSGGFNGPVTFSCAGLPRGAACGFAPASVTPSGAPVTTTLTIATDGGPVAAMLRAGTAPALALLLWVLAPLPRPWLHAWAAAAMQRRLRRWALAGLTLLVLAAAAATVGCGGGGGGGSDPPAASPPPAPSPPPPSPPPSPPPPPPPPPPTGTPAGTSVVTVTATSGSGAATMSRTVQITLTVTR